VQFSSSERQCLGAIQFVERASVARNRRDI
jgi:hypothetical protein